MTQRSRTNDEGANGGDNASFEADLLRAMLAFRTGDFSTRLPLKWDGVRGRIAEAFNEVVAMSERRTRQAADVARVVGKEGRLQQRFATSGFVGCWANELESLNLLLDDLARPTAEVARTIGAVAKGDLEQTIALEVDGRRLRGDFLHSAKLVNRMIDQLAVFTS